MQKVVAGHKLIVNDLKNQVEKISTGSASLRQRKLGEAGKTNSDGYPVMPSGGIWDLATAAFICAHRKDLRMLDLRRWIKPADSRAHFVPAAMLVGITHEIRFG